MKNKILIFIATIAIIPSIFTSKDKKNNKTSDVTTEIIQSNKNISKYPSFERNFLATQFFKQIGIHHTSRVILQDSSENILKAKNKYGAHNFIDTRISSSVDNKKIVLRISPAQTEYIDSYAISVQDFDIYQSNNVAILKKDCALKSSLEDHTKGYKDSKNLVVSFLRWASGRKKNSYTKPYKCCSLLSNNNKLIDIYSYKIFGCDAKFFFTSHPTPIAILIDEKGNILNILDNVQKEQDIFNAFGI